MKNYELQVHGKNELKRIAAIQIENVLKQLPQYLGKRIDTQSGKSKKFVVNMLDIKPIALPNGFASLHLNYVSISHSEITLKLSICLSGGKYEDRTYYCQYFDRTFYLGRVENFCLAEVYTLENIIKDYGLYQIIVLDAELQKIAKLKQLEDEVQKLRHSIQLDI
jgi:hypothetical protein